MHRMICLALILVVAPLAMGVPRDAAAAPDATVAQLRSAVTSHRSGSHLPLLFSLRQLRDPALGPVFERLINHDDWQVQVHGALGLAEVSPERRADPAVIARLSPLAQEAAIASALDMDMLGVAQMRQLLSRDELVTLPRLMLHAELMTLEQDIDLADVRRFLESEDLRVASLAALLLSQSGDTNALAMFRSRLESAPTREHRLVLPWLLDAVRQYRITSADRWLRTLWNDQDFSDRDRQAIVLTALEIDPTGNVDLLHEYLGSDPSYATRVRAVFILLGVTGPLPTHVFDVLSRDTDEELLDKLIAAGKSVAQGGDASQPLIDVLDLGHARATEWAMTVVKRLDAPHAQRVYRHLLDQLDSQRPGRAERTGLAVTAAARLFELDREDVVVRLHQSASGSTLQQALLLGMFESDSPRAGQAAADLHVVGFGREASLRLLLIARHATSLDAGQQRQLAIIAGGGGRVSDVLQTQAAWLHVKHAGKVDAAISSMFSN